MGIFSDRVKRRADQMDKDVRRRDPSKPVSKRPDDSSPGDEDLATLLSMGRTLRTGYRAIRDDIRRDKGGR